MRREINITIKYYSGIARELGLEGYDSAKGVVLTVRAGTRLRTVLRRAGLRRLARYSYFRGGERISAWRVLKDRDEVSCLKPSGGG
ncbi:MAG: hypothetical protein EPN93_01845 [Spirochaetes bacterium]|nr:MAG: hypothetical protein EPN93_01845 [Spirochaetota bacterium]